MTHTESCLQAQRDHAAEEACFEELWPEYCRTCGGWGTFEWHDDPSPAGVSLSPGSYHYSDPCPDCTEKSICARCSWPGLDAETGEGPCIYCGWNYDDGIPMPPECSCWVEEYLNDIARWEAEHWNGERATTESSADF